MLIRIRRLAGSVVGAAFILLLAISLLGTGNSVNPMAFFQGSPVVIEVGDEEVRWNTLATSNAVANALGLSAPDYVAQRYGPLTSALAVKDSWDGGTLTLPSTLQSGLAASLSEQGAFFTPDILGAAFDQIEPMANIITAISWQAENQNDLLPDALADVPRAQVTQTYDFDLIEIRNNPNLVDVPDEATLTAYITENREQYQRGQTWAIEALILDNATLAEQLHVTEDQVRLFYDQNPDLFTQPEAWDYQTLTFSTALEANLFTAQLDQGVDYDTAVAASTAIVTAQGLQENSAFSAETLALLDEAKVGVLAGPNEGENGSVEYTYLRAYEPEQTLALDEGYALAEQELKLQLASDQLSKTVLELQRETNEDGKNLQTVAAANNYELQIFEGLQFSQSAPEILNSEGFFERLGFLQEPREAASRFELEPGVREILFTVTS